MSQTVALWGATYSNVPAIEVPTSPSGTVTFTDVTPTTATDADVASGKIYFKADGTQSTGTASGGGGLTVMTGNFTPSSNITTYTINALVGKSPLWFILKPHSGMSGANGNGVRAFNDAIIYFGTPTSFYLTVSSNNGGTSLTAVGYANTAGGNPLTYDNGKITVKSGTTGSGYLVGGVQYDWYAFL